MANKGSDRFWYEVYREGVRQDVISEDSQIESVFIPDDLSGSERDTVDQVYADVKDRLNDPNFDLSEVTWFFDLAKAEVKQRL